MGLALAADSDLDTSANTLHVLSRAAATRQRLEIRLGIFKGEWKYDRRVGVPWLEVILRKGASLQLIRQVFHNVIATCPGVASVSRLVVARTANRGLSVSFTARAIDGTPIVFEPFVYEPLAEAA
jgi:hypothetical protein